MDHLVIRKIEPGDMPQVKALFDALFESPVFSSAPVFEEATEGEQIYKALLDGRLAGFASVSVGAAYGGDAKDMDALFEHADAALYERKRSGRCGCSFYRKSDTNY